jgi:hypothetical protein
MLGLIIVDFWLFGKWLPAGFAGTPTSPGDPAIDIFGQTIAVGNKVKLIGTVTAINQFDAHFQDITFTPDYPQSTVVQNIQGVAPQQQPIVSVRAHPLQLVKIGTSL